MVINIIFAISPLNSIYWWLRTTLYLATFIVLKLNKIKWEDIKNPLLISTTLVVIIEIIQILFQSSIGGIIYYLGERNFSSVTSGIGRFNFFGQEILRPQSTFSHPNSLAGYLLIVFYILSKKKINPLLKIIPFVGVILTLSKSAIAGLSFIIFGLRPEWIIALSIALSVIQPLLINSQYRWQSLTDRLFFYEYLKNILSKDLITGTGLGNFIPALSSHLPGSLTTPSKLQPIHNLPFLALSELGLLGALALSYIYLKEKAQKIFGNPYVLGLIALVIFTGTFDHYTWTLPQNKLILILALAIMH